MTLFANDVSKSMATETGYYTTTSIYIGEIDVPEINCKGRVQIA